MSASCPSGQGIYQITSASYGGSNSACTANPSNALLSKVEEACLYEASCSITASNSIAGDPCPGVTKSLQVSFLCAPVELLR